jgi:hypothetical protein
VIPTDLRAESAEGSCEGSCEGFSAEVFVVVLSFVCTYIQWISGQAISMELNVQSLLVVYSVVATLALISSIRENFRFRRRSLR